MKETKGFQCDNCDDVHPDKNFIFNCLKCNKEICETCGSSGFPNICEQCADELFNKINDREKVIIKHEILKNIKGVIDGYRTNNYGEIMIEIKFPDLNDIEDLRGWFNLNDIEFINK